MIPYNPPCKTNLRKRKFMMKTTYKSFIAIIIFTLAILVSGSTYSGEPYIMCGPDEDGCHTDIYKYCACIPYDQDQGQEPYCLDFDRLTCEPLSKVPNCDTSMIHKNQQSCVATIFQSVPNPPCPLRSKEFCIEHQMSLCDGDGKPESCKHV